MRVVTGDDVASAVETVLTRDMPRMIEAMGLAGYLLADGFPGGWTQVPRLSALSTADLPAGAICTPGWVDVPTRRRFGDYDATWRVVAGVVDRGEDYDDTARRTRLWAGVIRATLVANPSLDGLASSLRLASEVTDGEYNDRAASRTLGGCAVGVDVMVENVVDLTGLDLSGPPFVSDPPTVQSTNPSLTITSQE